MTDSAATDAAYAVAPLENRPQFGGSTPPETPYQLTVKRGLLALVVFFGCQTLVGLGYSFTAGFIGDLGGGTGEIDRDIAALVSVLGGSLIALLWIGSDVWRFGPTFRTQIGLRPSRVSAGQAAMMVVATFVVVRLVAWAYRSVFLPLVGEAGTVGGGSQMFAQLQDSGSTYGMSGFFVLAIVVGPVVEELVFRGYLQSSLARRLPSWGAIAVTSLVFTAGHGPMALWPMYFMFSAAWGWVFARTGSLKAAIAFHMLNNVYYSLVGVMGWTVLA